MAFYEIIETPGKKRVYPQDGDSPIRNQDEAKIIINKLRAEAKKEGRKVDFMYRRDAERVASNASAGTSIRLTEENRSLVARFCGRVMMETGEPVSMGDAVAKLAKVASTALDLGLVSFNGDPNTDGIVEQAKAIRRVQREATA